MTELLRFFPDLKVFTAAESFRCQSAGRYGVEVVGRKRARREDPRDPGYRRRLTLLSPRIIPRLLRYDPDAILTNSFGVWTTIVLLMK